MEICILEIGKKESNMDSAHILIVMALNFKGNGLTVKETVQGLKIGLMVPCIRGNMLAEKEKVKGNFIGRMVQRNDNIYISYEGEFL